MKKIDLIRDGWNIEFRWNIETHKHPKGHFYTIWDSYYWTWQLCLPGYTSIYYDGLYRFFKFGIGSLCYSGGFEKHENKN